MKISRGKLISLFVVLILLVDQFSKILVKTNMTLGESIFIFGDWFQIYFIENNGMAFGMQYGGDLGKFLLTAFRIVLAGYIIIYLRKLLFSGAKTGVLIGISMILIGAMGNIIDSLFYGVLFGASTYSEVAEFLPEAGGYAPIMFGKVVDMLYFPLIETTFPKWIPIWGGDDFVFFGPIFNVADSCITVGLFYLLLFQRKFLTKTLGK